MSQIEAGVREFATQFRNSVIARARGAGAGEGEDGAAFREEAFTELFIEALAETGAIDDGHSCHFERRIGQGLAKVNGYFVDDEDEDRLDLFVSIYDGAETPRLIEREDVVNAAKRALRFRDAAVSGIHDRMEPTDPARSMAQRIHEIRAKLRAVRIFVITDGVAKELRTSKGLKAKGIRDLTIHVWDIERLSRAAGTGGSRDAIEVDVVADYGEPIPCLPVTVSGAGYRSYLAVVRADILHRLYDTYGERLLELNVRSFLQARGKVNRSIRDTILNEPQHFFAYNNGLTAIAEEVKTGKLRDGGIGITWLRGLQIVNGGQTTASIHRAGNKDSADEQLRAISVQMKLSVVSSELVDEMVPRISLYANSQNKVSEADFSANHAFHQRLEELSRTIWTPDGRSRWFYERARGQYQVARAREGRTPALLRKFDEMHPSTQMFTKTDLAASEHSWAQLPHLVSRGGQKNFREFMLRLGSRGDAAPTDDDFRKIVARNIIYRHAQTAARQAQIAAYRANVVTYAVAYIASRAAGLDLRAIWEHQSVTPTVDRALREVLAPIGEVIVSTAGQRNVTEWCKKEECWRAVQGAEIPLPPELTTAAGGARRSAKGASNHAARNGDAVLALLKSASFEYIDKRGSGGSLWIVGDETLEAQIRDIEALGLTASYSPTGGRATDNRPAWYLR